MKTLNERLEKPQCQIGKKGWCCKICFMGPCQFVNENDLGVCGATRELVVARNILRTTAGGASAHLGHAYHFLHFLGKKYPSDYITKNAPADMVKKWETLGILPNIESEHFIDVSEALHTTTFGVNADYQDVLARALGLGILDGYYGMYLATEYEDEKYGAPQVKKGVVDLGVIDEQKVNIAVHGHEPMLAEALVAEAKKHDDINLVGVCCTGASLLSRHGVPLAAHVALQEDVIATGAVEVLAVDVQCIMPSISDLAECYHTKIITTSPIAKIPKAEHLPVTSKQSAEDAAKKIIEIAKKNKSKRKEVNISTTKTEVTVGFTPGNIPLKEIAEKLKTNKIKGVIAVVGCSNPRIKENWVECYKKLSKDYIILTTGCIAFQFAQAGVMDGNNFFHLGSCVNNARVAQIFQKLAELNNKPITEMPFMLSCPMPITEKAVAIGMFFAALGVHLHIGYSSLFVNDAKVVGFLQKVLKEQFNSNIYPDESADEFYNKIKGGLK